MPKRTRRHKARTVKAKPGLPSKEGRGLVIRKVLRKYGGDYRGVTYNRRTGRGRAA